MFHRVRIESASDNPSGFYCSVYLDGRQVFPTALSISIDADDLNRVTLTLPAVVEVDLPADITVTQDAPDPSLSTR